MAHVLMAAAANLLQSCPTLCNPIDGSPPGSAIPGILQARTLEWVAIAFSGADGNSFSNTLVLMNFPGGSDSLPTMQETRFDLRVGKISSRRKWQPTPVFLPGKSHGRRKLVGYSPCGPKELYTTERLHFLYFMSFR